MMKEQQTSKRLTSATPQRAGRNASDAKGTKRKAGREHQANARSLALDALLQIEQGGAYSNLTLQKLLNQHQLEDSRDRSLVTEIVYGTVQQQRYIDFLLEPFLKKGRQLEPWVQQLLRLSVYQFVFLDRVPSHAVVHEAVELAKRRGHRGISGMVNGVLRSFLRTPRRSLGEIQDPVLHMAIETSHPDWMVQRWVKQYGLERAKELCVENNRPPLVTVRVNTLKATRQEVQEALVAQGFEVAETQESAAGLQIISGGNVVQTSLFQDGLITVQDESSMLIAPLLAPEPGMQVLDACAAPGGKTTHLAEYMRNEGRIVAVDLHPHKEKLVQSNSRRLGITCIDTLVLDARKLAEQQTVQRFDRILLDAPCSGLGVIRRKPDLKWKKKEEDIEQIAAIQYELLCSLAPLLTDKGQLVYSTCTLDETENQGVIHRFLDEHPEFREVEGARRLILPQDFGSDGFFMTKLERNW